MLRAGIRFRDSRHGAPLGFLSKSLIRSRKFSSSTSANLPKEADVVVIGGGVLGTSVLYHLSHLGVSNAVLIEKDQLTSGTTWHSAGLLWRLRPNDIEIQLLQRTRELASSILEEETGLSPGWTQTGGMFIASTEERLDEYKRLATIGKFFDIESHVLTPSQTKDLYPKMNVDNIHGVLYSPGDGTIEPSGITEAFAKGAKQKGARVFENCSVTGFQTKPSRDSTQRENYNLLSDWRDVANGVEKREVTGVHTSSGFIKTSRVVNCAGAWSRPIGALAQVDVPLIPMKHAYVVTEEIDGIGSMPCVRDHDASVYLKVQGKAGSLAVGGYEYNPEFCEDVATSKPGEFSFGLYDLNYDVFGQHVEKAIQLVPEIEHAGIKSEVCGPESFTPDHKPLLGEAPGLRGFYLGCGFNSAGIMLSGGCGEQIAQWIVNGSPSLDMYGYDINRFSSLLTNNDKWIKERSHESYAKNYAIVWPHDEPLAARNQRHDPLFETLNEQGCVYQERLGWERPGWFSKERNNDALQYDYYGAYKAPLAHKTNSYADRLREDYTWKYPQCHDAIKSEVMAARTAVAVFNQSYFGKFYISGRDATKALEYICTNRISDRPLGATVYTNMLNSRGFAECDLTVSHIEDDRAGQSQYYIAAGGGSAEHDKHHILNIMHKKGFECSLVDRTGEFAMLSVQGPKSRELLQKLTGTDLSNEAFPFSTNKIIYFPGGQRVRAIRLTFVGELGWELHIPAHDAKAVYELLMSTGKPLGVRNAGYRAIESLSLEKGYRHWHADIRADDTPLESGLGFICKLKTDHDFLGRSALEKQKSTGLRKKIAFFTLNDPTIPLFGLEAIWRKDPADPSNQKCVGYLRRGEFAFSLGTSLGVGYVHSYKKITNSFLKAGEYEIESLGRRIPASIHVKSPFDPKSRRVQGDYSEDLATFKVL